MVVVVGGHIHARTKRSFLHQMKWNSMDESSPGSREGDPLPSTYSFLDKIISFIS